MLEILKNSQTYDIIRRGTWVVLYTDQNWISAINLKKDIYILKKKAMALFTKNKPKITKSQLQTKEAELYWKWKGLFPFIYSIVGGVGVL